MIHSKRLSLLHFIRIHTNNQQLNYQLQDTTIQHYKVDRKVFIVSLWVSSLSGGAEEKVEELK